MQSSKTGGFGQSSGLSEQSKIIVERFGRRKNLKITLYDVRRARDTAMLSMMECAKAWRNVGGEQGSTLVCACQSLLERHLKLTGHSLAVCKQHYQQYGSVEVSQIHTMPNE